MDLDLTPEQELIRKTARDFAEREIAPYAADYDRKEEFPRAILEKMKPLGFLGAPIPQELTKPGGKLTLTFKMPKAISPKDLGKSEDPRVLGETHQRRLQFLGHDLSQCVQLPVRRVVHGIDRVEAPDHRAAAPPAVLAEKRVAQDAAQPRLQIGARRELVDRPQRPRVRLLHEVLGVRLVAGEVVREIVERVGVGQRLTSDRSDVSRAVRHGRPWYSALANAPEALSFHGNDGPPRPLAGMRRTS